MRCDAHQRRDVCESRSNRGKSRFLRRSDFSRCCSAARSGLRSRAGASGVGARLAAQCSFTRPLRQRSMLRQAVSTASRGAASSGSPAVRAFASTLAAPALRLRPVVAARQGLRSADSRRGAAHEAESFDAFNARYVKFFETCVVGGGRTRGLTRRPQLRRAVRADARSQQLLLLRSGAESRGRRGRASGVASVQRLRDGGAGASSGFALLADMRHAGSAIGDWRSALRLEVQLTPNDRSSRA